MGFFSSLASSAGQTLGSNMFGGHKVTVETGEKKEGFFSKALDDSEYLREEKENREFKQGRFTDINEIQFGSDVDEISNALSKLMGYLHQLDEEIAEGTMFTKKQIIKQLNPTKELIIEKIEFGLLKLNKLDKETADYFKKKLDSINTPALKQ